MTQEQVRAGLARARADGKTPGRPKIPEKTERAVRLALKINIGRAAENRR